MTLYRKAITKWLALALGIGLIGLSEHIQSRLASAQSSGVAPAPSRHPAPRTNRIDASAYRALMQRLADAWSSQDVETALSCFSDDAVYMEPPDIQLFLGKAQLRPYFGALKPGTYMTFHNLWFDAEHQIGSGEYSFGRRDKATAVHGVVVTELKAGRIRFWREYQRNGPAGFEAFLSQEGKQWQWTIKNYP